MAACGSRARVDVVDGIQNIVAIAFACIALLGFALMIWAGQHQS